MWNSLFTSYKIIYVLIYQSREKRMPSIFTLPQHSIHTPTLQLKSIFILLFSNTHSNLTLLSMVGMSGADMDIPLWKATWKYSIKLKKSPTTRRLSTSRYMHWKGAPQSMLHGTLPGLELIFTSPWQDKHRDLE